MMRQRRRLFLIVIVTAGLSACGSAIVPVEFRDSSASVVTLRAMWQLNSQASTTIGKSREGVEAQYVRMKGSDEQQLLPGQVVRINGADIIGPQAVTHSATVAYGHVAYARTSRFSGDRLDLDAIIGVGWTDFRLTSRGTTSTAPLLQADTSEYGITVGLGLRWWFLQKAAVEGRLIIFTQNPFTAFPGLGDGNQTDMMEAEAALVYRPIAQVALRGGYAFLDLMPTKKDGESLLDIRLGGPFVGIAVVF